MENKSPPKNEVPSLFCWTKMGVESGQSLESIISRKELERAVGEGLFCWGIGNSLGAAPKLAISENGGQGIEVLFTKMKSPPKKIDVEPAELALWLHYRDESGRCFDLPEHCLISSRAHTPQGIPKQTHFALMCQSNNPLREASKPLLIDAKRIKNYVSSNSVGYSQVTSIVSYNQSEIAPNLPKSNYEVSFKAKLHGIGFLKLVEPIILSAELMVLYESVCSSTKMSEWNKNIQILKHAAREKTSLRSNQLNLLGELHSA